MCPGRSTTRAVKHERGCIRCQLQPARAQPGSRVNWALLQRRQWQLDIVAGITADRTWCKRPLL